MQYNLVWGSLGLLNRYKEVDEKCNLFQTRSYKNNLIKTWKYSWEFWFLQHI